MFFKESKEFILEDVSNNADTHEITIFLGKDEIGNAVYKYSAGDMIDLCWVEIDEAHTKLEAISKLLDYLCQKAIEKSKTLIFRVTDEDDLSHVYYKWFSNYFNPNNDYDAGLVLDNFESLIVQPNNKYFQDSYPTILLNPLQINCDSLETGMFDNQPKF